MAIAGHSGIGSICFGQGCYLSGEIYLVFLNVRDGLELDYLDV